MSKSFKVMVQIPDSRVADLLCTGFEGGIGYWARIIGYTTPGVVWKGKDWEDPVYKYVHYPLSEGGAVLLRDAELPDLEDAVQEMKEAVEGEGEWKLDRAAIHRGLELFPVRSPHHFAEWMRENEDADAGDVFIQLAVLGDIIYG